MKLSNDFINGWMVRERHDGRFEVVDAHGGVAGCYTTNEAAIAAALNLPRPIDMALITAAKKTKRPL